MQRAYENKSMPSSLCVRVFAMCLLYCSLAEMSMGAATAATVDAHLTAFKTRRSTKEISENAKLTEEAAAFVSQSEQTLEEINTKYMELLEELFETEESVQQLQFEGKLNEMMAKLKNISLTARSLNQVGIADTRIRQALTALYNTGGVLNVGSDILLLVKNVESLLNFVKAHNRQNYDDNEIISPIIAYNMNETNRLWEQWYEELSENATQTLFEVVDLIQRHANDFNTSAVKFWFPSFTPEFMDQIEQTVTELQPFYQHLHAYVRQILAFNYDGIEAHGPIPDHLFKHVQLNALQDDDTLPDDDFAGHNFSIYQQHFESTQLETISLLKFAESFYQSLGLDTFSEEYWTNNIYEDEHNDTICPGVIYGKSPNITLVYCDQADFQSYAMHHFLFSSLHAELLRKPLPIYFRYDYGMEETIGETVKLSAISRKRLESHGFDTTDKLMVYTNLRLAISTLFTLMSDFVEIKVLTELVSGEIKKPQLNNRYWALMLEHAGVSPPVARSADSLDLPYSFYADLNDEVYILRKYSKRILSYQLYQAACAKAQHTAALSDCDFYGNKDVGAILRKLLSLGSSLPYEEVLASLLENQQNLSTSAMIEYFKPARTWLEKAKIMNIGWQKHK